jgi:WD40 repeat protein
MSDFQEDEYLSLTIVRGGSRVVCGSQLGPLSIFNWGDFGDLKTRIVGHPMSVDAMLRFDEDCILTGSSDGRIRVVAVQSKRQGGGSHIVGTLGQHGSDPIESVALSSDGTIVASCSHDQPAIRLWSAQRARDLMDGVIQEDIVKAKDKDDSDADSDDSDVKPKKAKRRKKGGKKSKKAGNVDSKASTVERGSFFSGL